MNKANECTCPSGDGSLRWPCPAHPAEQAGGDERAAFELFVRKHCGMPEHIAVNWDAKFTNDAWEGWQARAALAQPSPMRCLACGGYHGNSGLPCPNMRVTAQAQPSPAGVQLSASRERRIYIAGPMTGYKDCNFPAFNAQAEALRGLGYHVENPADHGVVDGAEWQDYLRYDISRLSTCEAIFLLPGWSKSKGAALEVYIAKALGMTFIHHADAEREQPSPVQPEEAPVIGCLCGMPMTEGHHSPDGCSSLEEFAPHLSAQAQAKQAERPEVVGYLATAEHPKHGQPHKAFNYFKDQHDTQVAHWRERGCEVSEDELMSVAQHDRIVGALRAENAKLSEALDECDGDRWKLRSERDAANARLHEVATACATAEQQRDAAQARVAELESKLAELEKQEPVALANRGNQCFWVKWTEAAAGLYGPGIKLYAAPVAQAQQLNDLDKQCRDDVARALGLRPNQERGFAWSYLLASIKSCVKASGDSAQAQHSGPEGWMLVPVEPLLNMMSDKDHDTRITAERQLLSILAAAPGNSVPQAWLDVQAERRRQITAEGWTPEHDDEHADGQMAQAAGCYALHAGGIGTDWPDGRQNGAALFWPWDRDSWKPTTPRRDLVKACALALAEIERLDRAGISQSPQPGATTASS